MAFCLTDIFETPLDEIFQWQVNEDEITKE